MSKNQSLTIREIAKELGISRQRVHQYIQKGKLRANMLGNYIYVVDRNDYQNFLKEYKLQIKIWKRSKD
mgnify:CR=1 FL=1